MPTFDIECSICHEWTTMNADLNKVRQWRNTPRNERPLVQDAFPNMSADDRELMLTGICPDCWEKELT